MSDAVGDPSKSPAAPKEMHGPVMVAYYDRLVDRVTDLGDHDITDLTWSLKLIDPLIKVERLANPGHDVAAP